jgi:hypothetical protein
LAAALRDVDFRELPAFHGLRGTVWFWILRRLVSAWNSFRGGSYLSAAIPVFTGIFLEVFGFG